MRCSRRGLTLVEVLVVVAMIAVLAGIVYASMGPVRENARRSICLSNLRQLGMAIKLYRQDYGSVEFGPWHEMGLPPSPVALMGYVTHKAVTRCPNLPAELREVGLGYFSYGWNRWTPPPPPTWEEAIARRGADYPILYDPWHDVPQDYPTATTLMLILRLDGRAEARQVARVGKNSWEY